MATGRPLDPEATRAIVAATVRLLSERGYANMSVEGVAAEAGGGKPAGYRRFRDKRALGLAAIEAARQPIDVPDRGGTRGGVPGGRGRRAGGGGGGGRRGDAPRVDRVGELGGLAARRDGERLREVAVGRRGGHRGELPRLGGQVAGHEVEPYLALIGGLMAERARHP